MRSWRSPEDTILVGVCARQSNFFPAFPLHKRFSDFLGEDPSVVPNLKNAVQLHGHAGCVNALNFSDDGGRLATGSDDRTIKIWDPFQGTCLRTLRGHKSNVFVVKFVPGSHNTSILSAGNDADVRHYQLDPSGDGTCTVFSHHRRKILQLAICPGVPNVFLSASFDKTVRIFDTRQRYRSAVTTSIREIDRTMQGDDDDEDFMVIPQALGGGRVSRITPRGNRTAESSSLLLDLDSGVFGLNFNPQKPYEFITGCEDGSLHLYDLRFIEDPKQKCAIKSFRSPHVSERDSFELHSCVFSSSGEQILASYFPNNLVLYDVDSTESEGLEYIADQSSSSSSSSSGGEEEEDEENRTLLDPDPFFSTDDFDDDFFSDQEQEDDEDHESDEEDRILQGRGDEDPGSEDGMGSDDSPDSWGDGMSEEDEEGEETHTLSLVGTISALMRAYQARIRNGESLEPEQAHDGFSASWLLDNALTYNNLRQNFGRPSSRPPLFKIKHHAHVFRNRTNMDTVKGVNFFGPDSKYVVSGTDDGNVMIWDRRSGKFLRSLQGHAEIVNCIEPHPYLPVIATSGIENHTIVWIPSSN